MNKVVDITAKRVDIDEMRLQRDILLKLLNGEELSDIELEELNGVVNLFDHMLDVAEGYGHIYE